jgi:Protochlamydia outer membrane protein
MRYILAIVLLLAVPSFSLLSASVRGSLDCGYRLDYQQYSIASLEIDPLSKLKWSSIESFERGGELEWVHNRLCLGIEGAFSEIFGGSLTDYDWDESGERSLWSETISHVGGHNYDADLKVGCEFPLKWRRCVLFRPLAGISYHNMYYWQLHLYDCLHYYEPELVGVGVVSTHRSQWLTGWIGCDLVWKATEQTLWRFGLRGHGGRYWTKGDWRWRDDLLPGNSFQDSALAGGVEARLGHEFCFLKWVSVWCDLRGRYFATPKGWSRAHHSDGYTTIIRFNGAIWGGVQALVGVSCRF